MDVDDLEFDDDQISRRSELMSLVLQKIEQLEIAIEKNKQSAGPKKVPVAMDDDIFASERNSRAKRSSRPPDINLVRVRSSRVSSNSTDLCPRKRFESMPKNAWASRLR